MLKFRQLVAAAAGLLALSQSSLRADPTYEYRFDQSNYSVAPSGTVPVSVYLREFYAAGDTTLLDSEGLFGGGVRVGFNVPPTPSQPAQVFAPGDITYNPAYDGFSIIDLVPGDSGGFTAAVDFLSPPVTGMAGPNYFEIFLGTFNFTAGAAPGQVTNLLASDFGPSDDSITATSLTVLDGLIADASATITVQGIAVVPEPSTWVLWIVVGAVGMTASRRFSRRTLRPAARQAASVKPN